MAARVKEVSFGLVVLVILISTSLSAMVFVIPAPTSSLTFVLQLYKTVAPNMVSAVLLTVTTCAAILIGTILVLERLTKTKEST